MLSLALSQAHNNPSIQKCVLENKPETENHSRAVVHPCCRLYGQNNQIRSFSNVTISSIVEVNLVKQRSAPGSAALELQRSGAPGAPDQNNIATRFGPNDDEWKRLQRNKFGRECHNNTWGPTQCTDESITQGLDVCLGERHLPNINLHLTSTPATFNSFESPLQATSLFPPSSRNQIACL